MCRQLPSGSRWGFQGARMFPDATCAFGRQRPRSARNCRQHGCSWALEAILTSKNTQSSPLPRTTQPTLTTRATQAGLMSQEESWQEGQRKRWIRFMILFVLVPGWTGIGWGGHQRRHGLSASPSSLLQDPVVCLPSIKPGIYSLELALGEAAGG